MPILLSEAEGNTGHDFNRKSSHRARSKALSTQERLARKRESHLCQRHEQGIAGTGKAQSHSPVVHADEKPDAPALSKKPPNKGVSLRRQWRDVAYSKPFIAC